MWNRRHVTAACLSVCPWCLECVPAGPELAFPPIPSFSPELFAYMRCAPNQKKAFNKGIEGLLGEGAVQVG